jgi:SAM-dependent methyltransferase
MHLAVDPLDRQAVAAMQEPVGLDEHALLRAEAAADAHVSQAHMSTQAVGGGGPDQSMTSAPAADPAAPADSLEVSLERNPEHQAESSLVAPLAAPVIADEDPETQPEGAPDELQVSLTPTMGHAVTVTPETPPAEAEPTADVPVGLFIPSLTAEPAPEPEPQPEPEPEPELIHGSSISGEFTVPSSLVAEAPTPEPEPEPEPEPGASAEDSGTQEIDADELLEMEELEEEETEPAVPSAPPPGPPPAEARRRRHWSEAVFQEHYLATLPEDWKEQAEADVDFISSVLELEDGATILDVGCGNGRHVFAFADHGYDATGIDNSLAMLLAAGANNEKREVASNFLHADMRELPKDVQYDAVVCLGSTYGYFEDEVNRQVLKDFREILKPGGKLVIQVFNRDYLSARLPCRSWWASKRGMIVDEAEMNYFANRLRVHRTIVIDDGRNFEHYMFMKAFTLHDLGKSMSSIGLKVREVSGSRDTRGRFYGSESPDIWIVAERLPDDG